MWAWIAIVVAIALLILVLVFGILSFIRKRKDKTPQKKKTLPEARQPEPKVIPVTPTREDPTVEPLLIRGAPTNTSDSGYLQPRSSLPENTTNA